MPQPHIEVLGVYRLAVSDELLQEQFHILYGDDLPEWEIPLAKQLCVDQLESVVLIETLIKDRDSQFRVSDFTQPQDGIPRDSWQAPWAEAYLSLDGESLLVKRWSEPPQDEHFRCAFFLHFYQPEKPLRTSYGELICPPSKDMPTRLKQLVPFEPVD